MLFHKALTLGSLSCCTLATTSPNRDALSRDQFLSTRASHDTSPTLTTGVLRRGRLSLKSSSTVTPAEDTPQFDLAPSRSRPAYRLKCFRDRAFNTGMRKRCQENCSCRDTGKFYCGNQIHFILAERTPAFTNRLTATCKPVCLCLEQEADGPLPFGSQMT